MIGLFHPLSHKNKKYQAICRSVSYFNNLNRPMNWRGKSSPWLSRWKTQSTFITEIKLRPQGLCLLGLESPLLCCSVSDTLNKNEKFKNSKPEWYGRIHFPGMTFKISVYMSTSQDKQRIRKPSERASPPRSRPDTDSRLRGQLDHLHLRVVSFAATSLRPGPKPGRQKTGARHLHADAS